MKRIHRIFAMILAIVTLWTVIPMTVFADPWAQIETENKTEGDVSSANITLSVDPEALISYLKSGDKAAILDGISFEGLRDAFDSDELIRLFSEEEIKELAEIIFDDLKLEELLKYLDVDALIEGADMDALIAQIKALPNLQSYVLDYDKLMAYLEEDDLKNAIEYVDTDALISAHVDELVALAVDLDVSVLTGLITISEIVKLDGIDFFDVLNLNYIENTIGYDVLFNEYVDEEAMIEHLHGNFKDLKHELHNYIMEDQLAGFLKVHGAEIIPYLELGKLQEMLADKISEYADVEIFLNKPALYDLVRGMGYTSVKPYVNEELAKKLVIDGDLIEPKKLSTYIDMSASSVDMAGLMDSNLITNELVSALYDGGAIDLSGNVNLSQAKSIIIEQDLLSAEAMLPYIDLYETDVDMAGLMQNDRVITDGVRQTLRDRGAIDSENNVNYDLVLKLIIEEGLIDKKELIPYFELGESAINMEDLLASDLITSEIYHTLEDEGALDFDECVDLDKAKTVILEKDLLSLEVLVDYVDLDTCVINMSGLMADTALMTDTVYEALVGGGAVNVKEMVSPGDEEKQPLLTLSKLNEKGAIDIAKMIAGEDQIFDVGELEEAEVIDFETVLVGDPSKNLPGINPDWLVKEFKVFDLREMLSTTADHDPLFTVEELAELGIIDLHGMGGDYGYENVVDVETLRTRIKNYPDKKKLLDCIEDPADVISAVGVKNAVNATGESYASIIEKYVTEHDKFFEALGVEEILAEIADAGELDKIFDLQALVKALGIDALLEIVDIRAVLDQLIESGALKDIIKSLDGDTYISALTYALGVLEKNIHEIVLDGTVITEKDGDLLFIDPSLLVDTVLDELLPELDDLVNMGDDGRVFTASLSVTYSSADTENVKKTKIITVNAVLESGVERVRAAATRAKTLLERFLIHDINDGLLTVDLRLPEKFATALRVALERLSTEGDPALEELRDEILDLYDANVNDVSAFLRGLTLEQVTALLKLVDASKFSDAYGRVMTNRYVKLLLEYVKEATGQDFTSLTPEDLLIKAGELPTLEVLCDKLEARLGREIEQLDRLPEGEPAEILERLAARVGVELDVKKMLEDAAAQEDPLAALYEAAVARIEESGDAYEAVQGRVVRVLDRLLGSRFGEKLSVLHLDELYDGDGVFKYAKSITVDPMEYVRRAVEKGITLLDEKTSLPAGQVERVAEILLSYFKKDTELTLGLDTTLRAEDIYRIEFFERVGDALVPIRTAFLPAGTELATVQPYETDGLHVFLGWKDPTTGEICEQMPQRDVQVVAEIDDATYSVYFYAWDGGALLNDVLVLNAGEKLSDYASEMHAIVEKYLKQAVPVEYVDWKNHPSGTAFTDWETPIDADVALTWKHYYDVSLVDPATNAVKQTMKVPAGTVLEGSAYFRVMNDTVRRTLGHQTLPDGNIKWFVTGTDEGHQMSSEILANLSLTWYVSYQIKIMKPNATEMETLTVEHGESLADHLSAINGLVRESLSMNETQLPDKNIKWYDWTDTTKTFFTSEQMSAEVLFDATISWTHFFDVTVLKPGTTEAVGTVTVTGGEKLSEHRADLNGIVKDSLSATHPDLADENIVWFDSDGAEVDFGTLTVNGPMSVTWKLGFTVSLFWGEETEPYKTVSVVDGKTLGDYLADMNDALRAKVSQSITDENIVWYDVTAPDKTLDLTKKVVSNLDLSCNCFFTFEVLGEDGKVMSELSFSVPYGGRLSLEQIAKVKGDVLKYINETLGLDYITEEDVTFYLGTGEFTAWESILSKNVTLTWDYADYYQIEIYAPDSLGGKLLHSFRVLGGRKISDTEYATVIKKIRDTYYPGQTALPDGDIILIKTADGTNFGSPEINADVELSWRLAAYYNVEILYKEEGSDAWSSKVFLAREGNIFHSSWAPQYAEIIALRESIAGPAPEDYEYIWKVVDKDGNVTEERFFEQTRINKDLRLTWALYYNPIRYSISIVDPADPETVLWSTQGLKADTHVVTYLSGQRYGETEQTVWDWLQAHVAAADPHIKDYVHEYRFSWRKGLAGTSTTEIDLEHYRLGSDLVLTWKYSIKYDSASLGVVGAKPYTGNPEVDDYAILQDTDDAWVIRFKEHWFEAKPTEFLMTSDFLHNAVEAGHGIRFDATESAQKIELSAELLAKLFSVARAQGVELENLTLRYAPDEGKSVFDFSGEGSAFFTLDFYVNGSANGSVLKVGDFAVEHDPENGVFADVVVTLPFESLVANGNGIKTFVCFEEEGENGKRYAKYELAAYDLDAKTVSFYAPHFSSVVISNQYRISTVMPHLIQSGISAELLGKLPTNEDIAFYPIDLDAEEYYPAGAAVPIRGIVGKDDHLSKIDVTRTLVLKYGGEQVDVLPTSGSYVMPAHPIELCFEIAPKIYYVYYYVDGALRSDLTQAYTAYMIETPEELEALRKALLSLEPLGEEYTEADGWSWNGFDDRLLGAAHMYLSLVRSTSEESVAEKTVEVIYYGEDGVTVLARVTYKLSALIDLSALPTVESIVGPDTDPTRSAYWVNVADGLRVPSDYTAETWRALLETAETLSLRVAYVYRSFMIDTDGNVKVTAGENVVVFAQRGTEITVTLLRTVVGKIPTVLVKTASGEIIVKSVGEGSVSFVMPAEDVMISVTYTAAQTQIVGPGGDVQIGTIGELKKLPSIVIDLGMAIDLSKIPDELILVDAVVDGDKLILTYQYEVKEGTDAKALYETLLGAVESIEYRDLFIVNGKVFESAESAMAYIGETLGLEGWSDTVDKNLYFGDFAQATEDGFPWILILILSILLLLILLIVLFYVLYIRGIVKPNAFFRVITAIVSAFFALCMALARAWLCVLRLFGIDEERLVRRYPMLKRRVRKATLEESLDALKAADPSYDCIAEEISAARIASKTVSVMEALEISDEDETDATDETDPTEE